MATDTEPLVSVVTPVYNGEDFLEECIESVLKQTYKKYEYIIVDNCSTDRSLEIAESYARQDSRIRVHQNKEFVGVIENHNIAFSLMSEAARYCKVVSADDFIFPECIRQMVECGDAHPSVGIIGSYQLSGGRVIWQGFNYPQVVFSGVEICRQVFLTTEPGVPGFGTPTSIMYRADIIRGSNRFYPNSSPHADTSACFDQLRHCEFGFVYQVLSYERKHARTQSYKSGEINRYLSACVNDLVQYGALYLDKEELDRCMRRILQCYDRFLAVNYIIGFRDKEFWMYHKNRRAELGFPLTRSRLLRAALLTMVKEVLNPEQALKKVFARAFARSTYSTRSVQDAGPRSTGRRRVAGMPTGSK